MSLYQKYRPKSFADVIGQDHIVTTLEQAAIQDKLSHAYLFAGARGTGKTSVARILAKILLTKGIEDDVLCRQIVSGVEEGTIVDLIEIDAASNRRIEDARDLIEKIQFSPIVGHAKVYIVDEAHMLTKDASNALLKTLEEPPPYAYFILATTELQKILQTIQSRCQRFLFHPIAEEEIIRGLQRIVDAEHITIDRPALRAIAHHAQGGMRDAISLLDQLRSLPTIGLSDVRERIGESGVEHAEAILTSLEKNDRVELMAALRRVEESGMSLDTLTRLLLTNIRTQLHETIDRKEPIDDLAHVLSVLLDCIRDQRIAPVPALVLEAALLSLCGHGAETKEPRRRALFTRKQKESGTATSPPGEAAPPPPAEASKNDARPGTVEAPDVTIETLRDAWPQVLAEANPPSVKMSLKNGRIAQFEHKTVTVAFSSAFHRDKVAENAASRAIEGVLEKIFRRSLRLQCVVDRGDPACAGPVDGKSVNLAEAVAEIF